MRLPNLKCICLLAVVQILAGERGFADTMGPRAVQGNVGMVSVQAFSSKYKPSTRSYFATGAALDVGVTPRGALSLSALMTANEGLVGWTVGWRTSLVPRRLIDSGGQDGVQQYTTTSIPRWHFDLLGGVSRFRFSQLMTPTDTTVIRLSRQVPIKADMIGLTIAPSIGWAWGENWKLDGIYSFNYGAAGDFTVIGHGVLAGVTYSL